MPISTLSKRLFSDPLLKAVAPWPAGLGAGSRGGKVLSSKTGNIRYAPRTTLRVPTKGAPQEWQHAIKTIMPKARPDSIEDTAAISHHIFPKVQAHEFLRGFHVRHGDYHSKLVRVDGYSHTFHPDDKPFIQLTGHVFHTPTGRKVGEFHREFERDGDEVTAHHGRFEMNEDHQGSGFGTHFYNSTERHYRQAGVTRVKLHANIKVGPYVWAMNGYDFESHKHRERTLKRYNTWLEKQGEAPFRRRHDIPFHSRSHPLHPWEIATHERNGRRLGKEFLTQDGDDNPDYLAVKNFDGGEGQRVGTAYQRSHLMRKQNVARDFAKGGPPEEQAPSDFKMDRTDTEGLERHMEPWHLDEDGEAAAHAAVTRVVDEAHGPRPETVVAETPDKPEPDLTKAEIWREGAQWYVNEEWLWKAEAEPFGLMKASIKPIAPIRSGVGGMIANRPSAPPQPKLSKLANAPKLARPKMPEAAGHTMSSKDVPRTSDGRIDWGSVTPGSSFWVTLHDPSSPLQGRAVRITKRGAGMKGMAIAGASGLKLGRIKPTSQLGSQLGREEKQLGMKASRVRAVGEAADTSKMSSQDIRAAAQMHGRLTSKNRTPEEEAVRSQAREKSESDVAKGARRTFNKSVTGARKAARRITNSLVQYALGHAGHDEEGLPANLEEKELVKSFKKLQAHIQENRKFRKLNPQTQDLIAKAIRDSATVLDNWQRWQQKLALENELRKRMGKKSDEPVLPVDMDIGEAGIFAPNAIHHGDGKAEGRSLVFTPSTLDDLTDVAKQLENGVIPQEVAEGQIKGIIADAIEQNKAAAQADEEPAPTEEQTKAKEELTEAIKDPDTIAVKAGRKKQSVRRYVREMESRLLNKRTIDALQKLDVVRAGLGEAMERSKRASNLFREAQTSRELGPWVIKVEETMKDLDELVQLVEKGDPLPEERINAAQALDPKIRETVLGHLGRGMNSRRLTSTYGAELLPLKYGSGIDDFGSMPAAADIEPPNVDTMTPEQVLDTIANHPEKGGDAILHTGPYFQAQALRTFEEVRRSYFPEVPARQMRNYVHLYGLEVTAHMFAQHMYRKYVVDVRSGTAQAPELSKQHAALVARGKMKPENAQQRAWEGMAQERDQKWSNVIERLNRDAAELNPVTERDMIRNETRLEQMRDALDAQYQAARKSGDEGGATDALLRSQALTARGAQNAGMHLGSMMAQWELMNAMTRVKGDYRNSGIPLTTEYGEDKELAQTIAKRVFKIGWEQHVENQGSPEKPHWVVTAPLGKWMGDGASSIAAHHFADEKRMERRGDQTRGVYDADTGERYATDESLPKHLTKHLKEGVRIREGQRNAMEVLHDEKSGLLDHTTGFGKTGIGVLAGLNEIGHAEAEKKQHRMLIIHNDDGVWGTDPELSSWKGLVNDEAPVHSIPRSQTNVAVEKMAGLKDKSGIVMLHHRDLANEKVKQAVRGAGFHRILVDEPQTPGMILTPKGGYTNLARMLYGTDGLVKGSGQNDDTGAHLILSSATLANPDTPAAMYKQLSPLLKRAGTAFGSRRQWNKLTAAVGSLAPSAQPGTVDYLKNLLSGVQTSDPKFRYSFPMKAHEHTAPLTPEQHSAVADWSSKDAVTRVVSELLKQPADKVAKDDLMYTGPRTQTEWKRNQDLYDASRGAGKYHGTLTDKKKGERERKSTEWLRMVEQTRRERQSESVYGMPRAQFAQLTGGKGQSESLIKKHAPVWHDFLQQLKPGEKTVMFMNGSRYLTGVAHHMTSMRMAQKEMHGGKADNYKVRVVHTQKQPTETRAEAEARINKSIQEFNSLPDEHSGVLIFDGPLSGKNIGKADRVLIGDVPRNENGQPDVSLVQQSMGRAMRNRNKRLLQSHTLRPAWVPAMDDAMTMKRQFNAGTAYNPSITESAGRLMKSQTWLRVANLTTFQPSHGVFLSK